LKISKKQQTAIPKREATNLRLTDTSFIYFFKDLFIYFRERDGGGRQKGRENL